LLRNEAVGSVWHHAVEWLRHNASAVAACMLRSAVLHNIRLELGLPDACFADSGQGRELEEAGWRKVVGSLGDMVYAFPRVKFDVSSFQRVPEEPCFLTGMTDGDRPMFQGTVNGMGDGLALDNRNGIATTNNACSFHKGKNIEGMFTDILNRAKMLAVLTGVPPDPPFLLPFCLPTARVGGCDIFFEVTFLPSFNWRGVPRNF
jgi:hypothetical protein